MINEFHEFPTIQKSWTKHARTLAIVYPNLYYGGVYCLAPLIFYNLVNKIPNWLCHRKFLDSDENLGNYNLIGFTFQYELDIYNIKKLIKKHGLKDKITFAGGPVPNINPKILQDAVDFQILGEAEETILQVLKVYEHCSAKKEFLKAIEKIPGVFTKGTKLITYAENKSTPSAETYTIIQPLPEKLTKKFVFGNSFLLEIERGCPFNCKFCPVSAMHKKVKYYDFSEIKKIIDIGTKTNQRKKIIIYSASFTHPQKKEILKYLLEKNLQASVPSIKIETVDYEILDLIKRLGQNTLTIAPECNETLRKTLNKGTSDKAIFEFLSQAKQLGFRQIKAYFMLGLPNQAAEDIKQTIALIQKMKLIFPNLYISFNPFVPKPKTEFAGEQFRKSEIRQQIKFIKKNLKNTKCKIQGLSSAQKEYLIANNLTNHPTASPRMHPASKSLG